MDTLKKAGNFIETLVIFRASLRHDIQKTGVAFVEVTVLL
jgi:hypothetical protein